MNEIEVSLKDVKIIAFKYKLFIFAIVLLSLMGSFFYISKAAEIWEGVGVLEVGVIPTVTTKMFIENPENLVQRLIHDGSKSSHHPVVGVRARVIGSQYIEVLVHGASPQSTEKALLQTLNSTVSSHLSFQREFLKNIQKNLSLIQKSISILEKSSDQNKFILELNQLHKEKRRLEYTLNSPALRKSQVVNSISPKPVAPKKSLVILFSIFLGLFIGLLLSLLHFRWQNLKSISNPSTSG